MNRRKFLLIAGTMGLQACQSDYGPVLFNPCESGLPETLSEDEIVVSALQGIDGQQYWDGHVHLLGSGDSDSGTWINPRMRKPLHALQYLQLKFYLNAACTEPDEVDNSYLRRLTALQEEMLPGSRLLLLAFDYSHDEQGKAQPALSAFHTPNKYAAKIAAQQPRHFEWIASIHPYRKDAQQAVYQAAAGGARAVKWLPPAMGINPASRLCEPFYQAMQECRLPLLVHAGEEKAVHGANRQDYGNPLLLRSPLDQGVRVIVAHCASLGKSIDLDAGKGRGLIDNFELFTRLMDEPGYQGLLFGEISAMTQVNRAGPALDSLVTRQDWHHRLINATDYPLPAVMPLISLRKMLNRNYINKPQARVLGEVRRYNALLFDLLLKRLLRVAGLGLQDIIFASRRVFDPASR